MAKRKPKKLTKKQKEMIKKNWKPILIIMIILIIAAIVGGFIFKDKILEMIKSPESTTYSVRNIEITNDGVLSWSSVGANAEYTIKINNKEYKTNNRTYDIKQHKDEIGNGLTVDIYAKLPKHKTSYKTSIIIKCDTETSVYTFDYNYTYEGYYEGINYKMSDSEIFNKLHQKINIVTAGNGSQNTSYEQAKQILVESDIEPNKDTLYGIYDNAEIKAEWGNFEREHVWPNSKLGMARVGESNRNQGSDPHNLRAIIKSTNGSRSNRYFSNGSGVAGYTIGTDEYYPGDNHRGDVARILLYMAVRYKDILSLVEVPTDKAYKPEGAEMGRLSLLLDWHIADPVDDFEISRNEVIYNWQGNRNPFIDHPELFERVYQYIVDKNLQSKNPIQALEIIIKNLEIQKRSYVNLKEKRLF